MCEMSKRPAALRTAKCSSRIDVYCCGSSHPPKSTMRPPSATWRSYRGVRCGGLAAKFNAPVVIEVDRCRIDELEQLFVVAAARVGDHQGHVARPLYCPFQLFSQLALRRLAMELPAQDQLGVLVIGRGRDEQLGISGGGRLAHDALVHLSFNALLGK